MRKFLSLAALMICTGSPAWGLEGPALELGKTLFEATSLGHNGNSCATCHAKGKGLSEVGAYDDPTLKEMINFCIRDALKGTMFSPEAQELEALLRYVRELAKQ